MSRLVGDWGKAKRRLRDLQRGKLPTVDDEATALAVWVYKRLIEKVEEGDPSWPPLATQTVRKKGHGVPWLHTSQFLGSIEVYRKDTGRYKKVWIIGPTGKHTGAGMSNQELAHILEHGRTELNIPARPLFGPVFEELVEQRMKKGLREMLDAVKDDTE